MESAVVAHNAGYVIRTLEEQEDFCEDCVAMYSQPATNSDHNRFITLQGIDNQLKNANDFYYIEYFHR